MSSRVSLKTMKAVVRVAALVPAAILLASCSSSSPSSEASTSAEELTMIARAKLRQAFLSAGMGVTGANFAVAETGMIAIREPVTRLTLETPGGLVPVEAQCRDGRVERVKLVNVP